MCWLRAARSWSTTSVALASVASARSTSTCAVACFLRAASNWEASLAVLGGCDVVNRLNMALYEARLVGRAVRVYVSRWGSTSWT